PTKSAVKNPSSGSPSRVFPTAALWPPSGGLSLRVQSIGGRWRHPSDRAPADRWSVLLRGRRNHSGARHARKAANPWIPHGNLRLSDRLQRDSGSVVAAARGCEDAGPRRLARPPTPDALQRRRIPAGRRSPVSGAHLLHPYLSRLAPR